jgi:DNA-binding IclR family transcriptional regulator
VPDGRGFVEPGGQAIDRAEHKAAVREELERIRQHGFASSFADRLPDAACVAAPGAGSEIEAAIFSVVPAARFAENGSSRLAGLVVEAARQLTERLHGEGWIAERPRSRKRQHA